ALVLAILVIYDDHHPAVLDVYKRVFNGCQLHGVSRFNIRSTYLAMISNSRFTVSPAAARFRFVFSNVCGIIAMSSTGGLTTATVRLMPSTAMEPFSTI